MAPKLLQRMAVATRPSAATHGATHISRGSRRDFVDLYLLCRRLPLADLLAAAPDKFGHVGDFALQALKGLADLSEVEGEPMPPLAQPIGWEEVAAWVDASVRELGAAHVDLGASR